MVDIQDYKPKAKIEGVILQDLKTHSMDDGNFTELFRIKGEAEVQVNHSLVFPGATKAFHAHEIQWDKWVTLTEPLLVGLYDLREDSPTYGTSMRFMLFQQVLTIPPKVLHGCRNNLHKDVNLLYAVNRFFRSEAPDEGRHNPYLLGEDFWKMSVG